MPPARLWDRSLAMGLLAVTLLPGCQSFARRGDSRMTGEPALKADVQPGVTVVEPGGTGVASTAGSSPRLVAAMDRHPLLRKPREYYDNTNSNKALKVAAATVVGVPAGIVGELKQIVMGTPSAVTTTASSSIDY